MITDAELQSMSINERNETLDDIEREAESAADDLIRLMWETHPARL